MTGNVLLLAFSLTGTALGGGSDSQGFVVALVGFVVGAVVGAAAAGRRGQAGPPAPRARARVRGGVGGARSWH